MIERLLKITRMTPVDRELRALLGYKEYKLICKNSPTLTQRIQEAAILLRTACDTLCEQLAFRTSMVFVRSIPSLDATELPRRFGLRELRRLSVLPLIAEGEVRALFGLDRERLLMEAPELARYRFFMISPDTLTRGLNELEKKIIHPFETNACNDILCQRILAQISTYASDSFADSISLAREGAGAWYRLIRNSQVVSEGVIAAQATEAVFAFCAEKSALNQTFVVHGAEESFRCFFNSEAGEYLLVTKSKEGELEPLVDDRQKKDLKQISQTASTTRSVLVVDDNADFLKVLVRFLTREGFTVVSAQSAVEAYAHISTSSSIPHAIVCDLHMPSISGIDFIEKLKGEGQRFNVPTFFLTSDDSIESELATIQSGAEACIGKGCDPRVLVAHLKRVCEREAA